MPIILRFATPPSSMSITTTDRSPLYFCCAGVRSGSRFPESRATSPLTPLPSGEGNSGEPARRTIMQSVAEIEASPEVQDLRNRVSGFLNELIYPNEKILERGGEEASRTFKAIQAEAKKRGLWALGLPKEIGGGGLEFMPYVFVNDTVGRGEYAIAGR